MDQAPLLAVAVGNTRTRLGLVEKGEVAESASVPSTDVDAILASARALCEGAHEVTPVIASVNEPVADRLETRLGEALSAEVYRIGRDIHVPMRHTLEDPSTLGHDRVLCALGAYAKAQQACVVIDAGTAITVDFVDGEGVFHGGVIAPGLRMMLKALHEQTSALPLVELSQPDPARGPFGRDTRHAMLLGVRAAAIGVVHLLIDRYAEFYKAYPQIVATGGDALSLFEGDPIVEHVVPDLQLLGIATACRIALQEDSADDDQGMGP
jgi:type III pantothenate kinase